MKRDIIISLVGILCFILLMSAGMEKANIVMNSSFEKGGGKIPQSWQAWGQGGSFKWKTKGALKGERCMEMDGTGGLILLYQWTAETFIKEKYTAKLRIKKVRGNGKAFVKIEFFNKAGEKLQYPKEFNITGSWRLYEFTQRTPENATSVAVTFGVGSGSIARFDNVRLFGKGGNSLMKDSITFDLSSRSHQVHGYGAQVWANQNATADEFKNLNMNVIRITDDHYGGDREQVKKYRKRCEKLGVKWMLTMWRAYSDCMDEKGVLNDIQKFADEWAERLKDLEKDGCLPEYIDLMNEPDSMGKWSTGFRLEDYNEIIRAMRKTLDKNNLKKVKIVNPGATALSAWGVTSRDYLKKLDKKSLDIIDVFASHSWDSGEPLKTEALASGFFKICKELDPEKPVWITEYATAQRTYHTIEYPNADTSLLNDQRFNNYNASYTMPYAIQVFANTLVFLNLGANIVFYWHSEDFHNSAKQWGYVRRDGSKKPVYYTLKAIYGMVEPGSWVITPPSQKNVPLYSGVFYNEKDKKYIVAAANVVNNHEVSQTIRLNTPEILNMEKAVACIVEEYGKIDFKNSTGIADKVKMIDGAGQVKFKEMKKGYAVKMTLPKDSILTLVLSVKR